MMEDYNEIMSKIEAAIEVAGRAIENSDGKERARFGGVRANLELALGNLRRAHYDYTAALAVAG